MMTLVRNLGRVPKGMPQFLGRAEGGAIVLDLSICLPSAAKQKVGIFYLPRFVEDRGQICFSRGSLPCFFLHVHMLRVLLYSYLLLVLPSLMAVSPIHCLQVCKFDQDTLQVLLGDSEFLAS